jgi:hypothetical protein
MRSTATRYGAGQFFIGRTGWVDAGKNDVILAPCGVVHGHRSIGKLDPSWMGGYV